MRLLSFLNEIEKAIIAESPMVDGGAWESSRMVNFRHGLARMTLSPREADFPLPGGTILLQAFLLADGSQCLKANLSWAGSVATKSAAVYSTPNMNWKLEASKIASAWLEGAPAEVSASAEAGSEPLAAFG